MSDTAKEISTTVELVCVIYYLDAEVAVRKIEDLSVAFKRIVIVDNKKRGVKSSTLGRDVLYVEGDNEVFEFSGYRKGAEFISSDAPLIVFCNDTVFTKNSSYMFEIVYETMLQNAYDLPTLYGKLTRGALVERSSMTMNADGKFVQTNIFGVNASGKACLEHVIEDCSRMTVDSAKGGREIQYFENVFNNYHQKYFPSDDSSYFRKKITVYMEQLLSKRFYLEGLIYPVNTGIFRCAKIFFGQFGDFFFKFLRRTFNVK